MCSISSGNVPVYGLISLHPHFAHLFSYLSKIYFLIVEDKSIHLSPVDPSHSPSFHCFIFCLYLYSLKHFVEQYLFFLGISLLQLIQ